MDIGINDFAYHSNTIDEVLVELERLQVIILGGDVYRLADDELVLTYDSWSYNLVGNQSDFERSRRKARDYITDYLVRNGEDYYFSTICQVYSVFKTQNIFKKVIKARHLSYFYH